MAVCRSGQRPRAFQAGISASALVLISSELAAHLLGVRAPDLADGALLRRLSGRAAGFRDMVSRHPAQANYNRFAYFACQARDRETLLELLDKVGDKPILDR